MQERQQSSKKTISILLVIVLLQIVFVLAAFRQPFRGDEVALPACALGVLDIGKPIYNSSITNTNLQCFWHPPTYIHLLALSAKIFGNYDWAFRLVGLIFGLATTLLVFGLTLHIFKHNTKREYIGLIAAALYALNPLTVQGLAMVDIDGGLLTFATMLFLYLYSKEKNLFILSLPLFFLFWVKESGPAILFASLIAFSIIKWDMKILRRTIALFLIAGIAFYLTFTAYTNVVGFDSSKPINNNFTGYFSLSHYFSVPALFRIAWSLKTFVYFVVPTFFLLFIFAVAKILYLKYTHHEYWDHEKSLLLLVALVSLATVGLFTMIGANGWGFPKYFIPAVAFMAIAVSSLFASREPAHLSKELFQKSERNRYVLVITLLLFYALFVLGDPLLPEFDSTAIHAELSIIIPLILERFFLYGIIPIAIALLFMQKRNRTIAALFAVTLFFYAYMNVVQATAPYGTYFLYGDQGLNDVISFFKENNITGNHIAAYPHVGYYYQGMSYFYDITGLYTKPDRFQEKVVNNSDIHYIVIYERDKNRIGEEGMSRFELETQIGTYFIYKKTA